jgi:hypothetical protein
MREAARDEVVDGDDGRTGKEVRLNVIGGVENGGWRMENGEWQKELLRQGEGRNINLH